MSDTIPQDTPQKQCVGPCQQYFPSTCEFFNRNKNKKDGLTTECKECAKSRTRAWKETHKKEISENGKVYYQANKDEINKRNRAYAIAHMERMRDYHTQYYLSRREEWGEKASHYRKTEQGRIGRRASTHKRRVRKKAIKGTLTPQQIQNKLKAQRHACYYCFAKFKRRNGTYIFHLDHTIPVSRPEWEPRHDVNYVVLACPSCNMKKHNRLPHEFYEGGRLF